MSQTPRRKLKVERKTFMNDPNLRWARWGIVGAGAVGLGVVFFWPSDTPESQWAASPGTAGFINLDDVKKAFQKTPKITDFEKRVNEIFEGDGIILLEMTKTSDGMKLRGIEDLNKNGNIDKDDETVFTLTTNRKAKNATLKGEGVNKYYSETFAYSPAVEQNEQQEYARSGYRPTHFRRYHYWGGPRYYTPYLAYSMLGSHRRSYRRSSAFRTQINTNNAFATQMEKRHSTKYSNAVTSPSAGRKRHISRTAGSSGFRNGLVQGRSQSGWGVRNTMAKSGALKGSTSGLGSSSSRSWGGSRSSGFRSSFRGYSGFGV